MVFSKYKNNQTIISLIKNTFWLAIDKILRLVINFFVTIYITRYLGPEKFGIWSYCIAFCSFFIPLSSLGIDSIITKDLVNPLKDKNKIITNGFYIKLFGSVLGILFCNTVGYFIIDDSLTLLALFIQSLTLLFYPFDIIDSYYNSTSNSKKFVYTRIFVLVLISFMKILMVAFKVDFILIILTTSLEVLIASIFLLKKLPIKIVTYDLDFKYIRDLIKKSWLFMFVNSISILHMYIDQFMIGEMLNNTEVGYYAVGIKLIEITYLIPNIIFTSINPKLIELSHKSDSEYITKLKKIIFPSIILSLLVSVFIYGFSSSIIKYTYGGDFIKSVDVMSLYSWTLVIITLGVSTSSLVVVKNLARYNFYVSLIGLATNICFNFILIKKTGIAGASIATLLSYSISFLSYLIFFESRTLILTIFESIKEYYIIFLKLLCLKKQFQD